MESDLSSDDEVTTIGAGDSDVEQINSGGDWRLPIKETDVNRRFFIEFIDGRKQPDANAETVDALLRVLETQPTCASTSDLVRSGWFQTKVYCHSRSVHRRRKDILSLQSLYMWTISRSQRLQTLPS